MLKVVAQYAVPNKKDKEVRMISGQRYTKVEEQAARSRQINFIKAEEEVAEVNPDQIIGTLTSTPAKP